VLLSIAVLVQCSHLYPRLQLPALITLFLFAATLLSGTPAPFRGNLGISQSSCEKSGCCWDPTPLDLEPWQPDVYVPPCFQPNGDNSGYALEQDDIAADGASGEGALGVCSLVLVCCSSSSELSCRLADCCGDR
jgi:hypothetical protein